MAISSMTAAKTACELSEWKLSNLALQKILYIAQMYYLGRTKTRLIDDRFQAWDYGPVLPGVYHRVKAFGAGQIGNVFHGHNTADPESQEFLMLKAAVKTFADKSPGRLVAITHHPDGAWAHTYKPGMQGLTISDDAIIEEFRRRNLK